MESMIQKELQSQFGERVLFDCSMKTHTTFAIGGHAAALIEVESIEELAWLFSYVREHQLCWKVIGKGSNLLVSDEGFDGIIMVLGSFFQQVKIDFERDSTIVCGAGLTLTKLVKWCHLHGFGGLEFLFGIPGTVGGSVVMNAGAFGGEMASIIAGIEYVDETGTHYLEASELEFKYRNFTTWNIYAETAVISRIWFLYQRKEPARIKELCKELVTKRIEKQPQGLPNAGSFFKNPEGDSAGKLIDDCGLKGMSVGGAMVSEKHGNFFVNTGSASAVDVIKLMRLVQETVEKEHGIKLQPEVHFIQ